ncbi:MAG: FecR family protein, partial [Myxococcaceae bacterium]
RPDPSLARVVSVRGASPLSANTPVWSGSTVSTQKKGELWLALPDGSRAGVLGDSRLTLAGLTPSELRLDLEQGTMVVDATHVEGRSFEVHAGEVDIRVTGTRFLVEHLEGRVLVAVSEGAVEVAAGERLYTVPAGRKLIVGKGAPAPSKLGPKDAVELSLLSPLPPRPAVKPPPKPPLKPMVAPAPAPVDAGVAAPVAMVAPAPRPDAGGDPDTEFAAYPGPHTQPPPRVVVDAGVAAAAPAKDGEEGDEEEGDGGEPNIIERLLELADIDSPWPPLGMSMEQHRLRQVQRQADKGQCDKVLVRADAWLEGYEADGTQTRAEQRKQMLLTKARCLSKLGRQAEAEAVRRDREAQ